MNVVWTRGAKQDLQDIRNFIAQDSEFQAQLFVDRLIGASSRLGPFPFSGRVVSEFSEDRIREVIVTPYRLIYAILPNRIDVLAVVHGARDIRGEAR